MSRWERRSHRQIWHDGKEAILRLLPQALVTDKSDIWRQKRTAVAGRVKAELRMNFT